jgi:hypothetical protein
MRLLTRPGGGEGDLRVTWGPKTSMYNVHCRPGPHTLNLPMPRSEEGGGSWGCSYRVLGDFYLWWEWSLWDHFTILDFHQIPSNPSSPPSTPNPNGKRGGGGGLLFSLFYNVSPLGTFLTRWKRRVEGVEVDISNDVGLEGDGDSTWRRVRVNVRYMG